MRYAFLCLFALLSTHGFAVETTSMPSESKPAKVYYRCESRGLDFDKSSQMKEIRPGKFVLTVPVSATGRIDNCVISVVDDESSGAELSFMDLFPSLAKDEPAVTEKSYSLAANQRLNTFKIDYKTSGSRRVTFEMKSRTFRVEKRRASSLATNK